MIKHYIVYSHGFAVRSDDRGLFTDIANIMPGAQHVQFDYNEFDEATNTLTARPFTEQVTILQKQLAGIEEEATIDIIAHSQGCVVVAMAKPRHIRKVVFLAPPAQILGMSKKDIYALRPGVFIDADGTLHMPRRDGTNTLIAEDYWKSRENIKPIELYNSLAETTDVTVVIAKQDEVLMNTDYSGLSDKIKIIELEANHDFSGTGRAELLTTIQSGLQP